MSHVRKIKKSLLIVVAFFAIFLFLIFLTTRASNNDNVFGAAWSDNIGWIAMNNCDYNPADPASPVCPGTNGGSVPFGVRLNQNSGDFSGSAWSSNIGWISFNQNDVAMCGSAPHVDIALAQSQGTAPVTGWAKATSIGSGDGFWDGCISLNSLNHPSQSSPAYGVNLNWSNGRLEGEAWGAEVIGWVAFSGPNIIVQTALNPDAPYISFFATPSIINQGGSSTLGWTTTGIATCSAGTSVPLDSDWTGNINTSSLPPQSATLTQPIVVTPDATTTYTISCVPIGGGTPVLATAIVNITAIATNITLSANPGVATYPNYNTNLTWSANVPLTSCTMASNSWVGNLSVGNPIDSTTKNVPLNPTNFTVTCHDPNNNGNDVISNTVTVPRQPPDTSISLTGSACVPDAQTSATIIWSSNDVVAGSCTGSWPGGSSVSENGSQSFFGFTQNTTLSFTCNDPMTGNAITPPATHTVQVFPGCVPPPPGNDDPTPIIEEI